MQAATARCSTRLSWRYSRSYTWRPAMAAQNPNIFTGPGADDLRNQKCEGDCRIAVKVPPERLPELLKSIPSWKLSNDRTALRKEFVARNFMSAIKFFNAVAEVAENEGHHPDLHLSNYREVEVILTTHDKGGLTMNDLILAAKIDAVPCDYSPKWLKQQAEVMAAAQQQESAL